MNGNFHQTSDQHSVETESRRETDQYAPPPLTAGMLIRLYFFFSFLGALHSFMAVGLIRSCITMIDLERLLQPKTRISRGSRSEDKWKDNYDYTTTIGSTEGPCLIYNVKGLDSHPSSPSTDLTPFHNRNLSWNCCSSSEATEPYSKCPVTDQRHIRPTKKAIRADRQFESSASP